MANLDPITLARFWSKVDVGSNRQCWAWAASCDRHGYGQFKDDSGKPKRSHRLAYELIRGEVEAGAVLRHQCHNPACCNPFHIEPGTQADNHADRLDAGRCPRAAGRFVGLK